MRKGRERGNLVCVSVANGNGSRHDRNVVIFHGSAIPCCQLRERASLLDSAISGGALSSEGQHTNRKLWVDFGTPR